VHSMHGAQHACIVPRSYHALSLHTLSYLVGYLVSLFGCSFPPHSIFPGLCCVTCPHAGTDSYQQQNWS
jgi:hypothetical protein